MKERIKYLELKYFKYIKKWTTSTISSRKNLFNSEYYKDFLSWMSFGCSLMRVLSAASYCSLFSGTRVGKIRLSKVMRRKYTSWSINPFLFLSVVLFSSLYLLSLSVYQPYFTIQNISSCFPLTLRVYLGLFIFVIPFSPIALCRSISLSDSDLAWFPLHFINWW